jgi:signal transduction histidine kinase
MVMQIANSHFSVRSIDGDLWGDYRVRGEGRVNSFPESVAGSRSPAKLPERLSDPRTADALVRGLLNASRDATVLLDEDGHVLVASAHAEKLFGHGHDELLGRSVETLVAERCRGLRKDGTEFSAEIRLSPIETPNGTLAAATIWDVTKRADAQDVRDGRKRQESAAEERGMPEANRLKSEFLANMSHNLRTPLNAIIGFADLMFRGKVGPVSDDHKEYLGDILSSSHLLLDLLNDVLDLARVESGKMEFHPEPLELASVVAEVCNILRGLAASKRIHIETSVEPGLAKVVLDESQLKQVLYNYLSSALKVTPEECGVAIRVMGDGSDHFRIEVEDAGVRRAMSLDGTAGGLALTKAIIEAQGGHVGVRRQPGKGTTFWAVLPRDRSGSIHIPLDLSV